VQPLLQWESNKSYKLLLSVCRLTYQAHNAHALFIHIYAARLYNNFLHNFINGMIFEKKKTYRTQNVL